MTDLEGVAGVLDFHTWCHPSGRYFEAARELLTEEVNAAVRGFLAAGATGVLVADGHGFGGIDPRLLHPEAELLRGWPDGYPFNLDRKCFAAAWVGQHAKSRSIHAHLAHTGSFDVLDFSINDVSVGEFGRFAMCASELGVRSIFLSGDQAAALEARTLIPGVETVTVKRGLRAEPGDELSGEDYSRWNEAAIHSSPARARELVFEGARRALERALREDFGIIKLRPPFECELRMRPSCRPAPPAAATGADGVLRVSHPRSVIELLNLTLGPERKPLCANH